MLDFTPEQQAKIGVQQQKLKKLGESQPQKDPTKKSLTENFISFLSSGD